MRDAAEMRAHHEVNQTFLGDVVGFVISEPRDKPFCRPRTHGLFRVSWFWDLVIRGINLPIFPKAAKMNTVNEHDKEILN